MAWSTKYKKSIDCNNPKGFSQKAHCAGRKARQKGEKTKSKSVSEMKTQKNEVFGSAKRFSDAFFDGLKNNATNSILSKAKKQGMPSKVIQKMEKLQKEKNELDSLIKKYSK